MLACEVAQPGPLGAKHDAEPLNLGELRDRRLALGGEPGDKDAVLLQPFDGAGKVDDPDHRKMFKRAGGGAGKHACLLGRVAMRRHHRLRAKRQAASENGADIARVGQPVEKKQADGPVARCGKEVVEIGGVKRPDGGHHALMNGPVGVGGGVDGVKPPAVGLGNRWQFGPARGWQSFDGIAKRGGGLGGGVDCGDPPFGVGKRGKNGVTPP